MSRLMGAMMTLFFGAAGLASAATDSGTIVLTGSREIEVRWIEVPPAPGDPLGDPAIRQQERAVRKAQASGNEGSGIRDLFAGARWDLHPDGTFQVAPGPAAPGNDLFPLTGSYLRREGVIEIRARSEGKSGLLSLDGLLRGEKDAHELEAVLGRTSILGSRFARFRQSLSTDSLTALARIRTATSVPQAGPPREGWHFVFTLGGNTGDIVFEGLQGDLFITPVQDREYALSLTTTGSIQPGWIFWSDTPINAAALARGETVTLAFEPKDLTVGSVDGVRWYTAKSGSNMSVFTRKATLRLRLVGQQTLEGEIEAEGMLEEGLAASHYRATLQGRPKTSALEQLMSAALGETDFTGTWRIEDGEGRSLGDLALKSDGTGVAGMLAERSLAGRQAEGRLDLEEAGGPGDRIFLRKGGGRDVAAGLWLRPGEPARLVTARRMEPAPPAPEITAALATASESDADTLRLRSNDLILQGRCEEARWLLENALRIYGRTLEVGKTAVERRGTAVNIQVTLQKLFSCHQGLEGLQAILSVLGIIRELLEVQRTLDRQTLQDQVRELQGDLNFFSELIEIVELGRFRGILAGSQDPRDGNLLQAVAMCDDALQSLARIVRERSAGLKAFEADLAGRKPRELHRLLGQWRTELEDLANRTFEQISATGRDILAKDPQLLESRDRYWQSIRNEAAPPLEGDLLALQRLEDEVKNGVHSSTHLRDREKGFFIEQTKAGMVLRAMAGMLDAHSRGLAVSQPEGYLEELAAQSVDSARSLALNPEALWPRIYSDAGKQAALSQVQPFFADLISFLLDAGRPKEALEVSEIARARAFVDLLSDRKKVRQELEKATLSGASGRALPSPLATEPIPVAHLIEVARRRGGPVIEYFLLPETLAIWVITPEGDVEAVSTPAAGLREAIAEFRRLMEEVPHGDDLQPRTKRVHEVLRSLHGRLIRPVASFLPLSADETVTLVPHEDLFGVPFAALEDEEGRFLIERHPLAYGASLSVLHLTRKIREEIPRERPEHLLALVNPSPLPPGEEGRQFSPLAKLEQGFMDRIAGFYTGREILTGPEANREALFQKAPQATVLHLATHAQFVNEDPLDSFIALAHAGSSQDGRLRVTDVFKLGLKANLVILWACETGLGKVTADGVEGLSRAFTWAGAPSLILSLWEIPENLTLLEMHIFHELWRNQGHSKVQALQRSLAELARRYPHQPELWAGLVLYGEAD